MCEYEGGGEEGYISWENSEIEKKAVYIFRGDLLKIEDPIYLLSIYVANSTHVWFFTHVCGKIHILHRVQLCGFHHTGVFNCTYVWK